MTDLRLRIRGLIFALPTVLGWAGIDFQINDIHSVHDTNPTIMVEVTTDWLEAMRIQRQTFQAVAGENVDYGEGLR